MLPIKYQARSENKIINLESVVWIYHVQTSHNLCNKKCVESRKESGDFELGSNKESFKRHHIHDIERKCKKHLHQPTFGPTHLRIYDKQNQV